MSATSGTGSPNLAQRADQLVAASKRGSYDPFVAIDWSIPVDDRAMHLPGEFLPLYGTHVWDSMDPSQRCEYSRHECASMLGTGIVLENVLMACVIKYLYRMPPDDPSHRYLLLEIADECRHSAMFGEYVRRAGTPAYQPREAFLRQGSLLKLTHGPVGSFIAILAAEELLDVANRGMRRRDMHPIAREVGRIHVTEEARHVAFARTFLEEKWPELSATHRLGVSVAAPLGVLAIVGALVNPAVYRALRIENGYRIAKTNPARRSRVRRDLGRLTRFLTELGVISRVTRPAWERFGLL